MTTLNQTALNQTAINSIATQVPMSFFAPAKNLTMLGYASEHQLKEYVPTEEKGYIFRSDFIREYRSWHNFPGEFGFMIVGPTGSGKTTAVLAVNHYLNIPTMLVSCHRDMSILELKGTMQFVTDPTTQQTVTKHQLGPVAFAFKHGLTLIMDEQNLLDPGVNAGLNETIRGKTLIIEATGEVIHRHPMFRYIATGNDWGRGDAEMRLAGINQQNAAYLNRFWKFQMNYPTKDVELSILKAQFAHVNDGLPDRILQGMVDVAEAIRPCIRGIGPDETAVLDIDFSTRTLSFWADACYRFMTAPNAISYALDIVLLRSCNRIEREVIMKTCQDKFGDAIGEFQ
jgi:cobaltochelatase CobS